MGDGVGDVGIADPQRLGADLAEHGGGAGAEERSQGEDVRGIGRKGAGGLGRDEGRVCPDAERKCWVWRGIWRADRLAESVQHIKPVPGIQFFAARQYSRGSLWAGFGKTCVEGYARTGGRGCGRYLSEFGYRRSVTGGVDPGVWRCDAA